MLDLFFDALNWFENLKRARDPLEAQYKGYQRAMLRSGFITLILLLAGWIATPSMDGAGAYSAMVKPAFETIWIGVAALTLIASAVFAWNLIAFYWFCRKHGIGE